MARRRRKNKSVSVSAKKTALPPARRRRWVVVAVVAGALGAALYFGVVTRQQQQHGLPSALIAGSARGFNVVVVTLDTTRADHLGCYGYGGARTPALDGLARVAVRFADAVSPVPLTLPSHTSMFTGLDPPNHGVWNNSEYRLDPSLTTLAEVLKKEGYQTAAFISAFVLDARYGLDQGFDRYDDMVQTQVGSAYGALSERSAGKTTDEAIRWLDGRDDESPFFLWVHYFSAHYPYEPPMPYAATFAAAPYDGEIAYADAQFGRLLDHLEADPGWSRTVVIVAADHGESLWEHGESAHSRLIYEATQHVPLLLAVPGLFQSSYVVDDVVVTLQDVFPTVLDLLGIETPTPCDGVSLLEAVERYDRVVYMETMAPYLESAWAPLHALRRHKDKYILAPEPEYYDLTSDPQELENLFANPPSHWVAARDELVALMDARMKQFPPYETIAGKRLARDPETLSRLESLGYVSGGRTDESVGKIDPKYAIARWEKTRNAKLLISAKRYDEAWILVNEALAASPLDRSALEHKGTLHATAGEWEEAEAAYQKAVDVKASSNGYTMVAAVLVEQGKLIEAQEAIAKAIELEPEHGGAWVIRGELMTRVGRLDDAVRAYEEAAQVDPYRYKEMALDRAAMVRRKIDESR